MYSDLSASEVLASHMASSEKALGEEDSLTGIATSGGITYPSHQDQGVKWGGDVSQ